MSSPLDKGQQPVALPRCMNCKRNKAFSWRNLYCQDCMVKLRKEIEASLEKGMPLSEKEEPSLKSTKRKLRKGQPTL